MDENINKKYNRLTIIKFDHKGKYNEKYYLCKCDCGKEKIINVQSVKSGKTKSCGCSRTILLSNLYKKYNKYEIKKDYVVGYSTNTKEKFFIDIEDYEKIKNISWYKQKNGYLCHKETGKKVIFMHRYLMNCPSGMVVDHINHNKADNRKNNLRITNYSINCLNRKKLPNGICKQKVGNKIYYSVQLNGYRGSYKNYEEAKKKRNEIIKNEYLLLRGK